MPKPKVCKDWQKEIHPGDVYVYKLSENNPTTAAKLVRNMQIPMQEGANTNQVHVAMCVGLTPTQPPPGRTPVQVLEVNYGREIDVDTVPVQSNVEVFRLNSEGISFTDDEGFTKTIKTEELIQRALSIAMEFKYAKYSVKKCFQALEIQKNETCDMHDPTYLNQYIQWLHAIIPNPEGLGVREKIRETDFMCVFFILYSYQMASIQLLGGIPDAFKIHALSTPHAFNQHMLTCGHFTGLPGDVLRGIKSGGMPEKPKPRTSNHYEERRPSFVRRLLFWRSEEHRAGYTPLQPTPVTHEPMATPPESESPLQKTRQTP